VIVAALDEVTGLRLFGAALAQLRAGVDVDSTASGEGTVSAAPGDAGALDGVARGLTLLLAAAQAGVAVAGTLWAQLLYGFAPETSVRMLEACRAADARADYLLGLIAFRGRPGVPADAVRARAHQRAAADAGNADAMFELGLMLTWGHGGDEDPAAAAHWE
jgi:TPR repeat protein